MTFQGTTDGGPVGYERACIVGGGPPLYGSLGGWLPMNSRKVKGGKVLPGALEMSSSVNRWRTWQRAVAQCDQGGAAAMKKSSRM